jgi:hypothetical protein
VTGINPSDRLWFRPRFRFAVGETAIGAGQVFENQDCLSRPLTRERQVPWRRFCDVAADGLEEIYFTSTLA